jgi:hypothetical protein
MERQTKSTSGAESNPKTKENQGLDYWASNLLSQGKISRESYNEFKRKNNSKEILMAERGLPQLRHYGEFASVTEIRERLATHADERFIIRCTARSNGEIRRLVDANLDDICDFAANLPGGVHQWVMEVKEFAESVAAGTIIVQPNGHTVIETWRGPHYLNTTNVPKYHAEFDPERFDQHYHWSAPAGATDLPEMQEYALQAVRYHFPYLKPKDNNPIYIEYGVKRNGQVYFIEANDDSLLTGK